MTLRLRGGCEEDASLWQLFSAQMRLVSASLTCAESLPALTLIIGSDGLLQEFCPMHLKWHHFRLLFTELQRPLDLDITHDELTDFDVRFRLILRKHLVILAWWSIFNMAGGALALFFLEGTVYYFWMMGMIWGLINFMIAMVILDHTFYRKFRRGAFERFEAQRHVEKLMFLNIGIDSAYIFAGLFLREHSFACNGTHADLWLGFGWAVIVQGVFLLAQDVVVYRLHRRNFKRAQPFLEKLLGNRGHRM